MIENWESAMPAAGSSPPRGVTERIESILADPARRVAVTEVRLGLGYSAVLLEDGGMGLAYTFRREARGGCCVFDGLRPLVDRPASDLLPLMGSADRIEAAVGLACACALANRGDKPYLRGDVLAHLTLGDDEEVGMVGYFGPLVEPVRSRVRRLTVYEWVDEPQGDVRPAREAAEGLGRCQVALITGTAIINHTIDGLLEASRGCRSVAILGASTPLLAEAFEDLNVSLLSGVVARDPASIFQVISEGGGMRQFGPHVDKVNLRVSEGALP
jgi:uncharacterized protein (DUF4213/DUF364 family)